MATHLDNSSQHPHESHHPPTDAADGHAAHVLPVRVYILVWLALMLLLGLTLLVGQVDLDAILGFRALNLNMIAALLIAGTKAALVLLFFMHVKYSSRLTWVFAGAGLLWLVVLVGLTMSDYLTRGWRY